MAEPVDSLQSIPKPENPQQILNQSLGMLELAVLALDEAAGGNLISHWRQFSDTIEVMADESFDNRIIQLNASKLPTVIRQDFCLTKTNKQ